MSSTIAQKVDTQARVIRSLNLIHCADTQHMVGAVELERLLIENQELKQRMKDDGEYICTLSERCERYRDALLKHKEENQHLTDKIQQLYEGAEEQKQRIKRLEETGDALYENSDPTRWDLPEANARKLNEQEAWRKAKEAKP